MPGGIACKKDYCSRPGWFSGDISFDDGDTHSFLAVKLELLGTSPSRYSQIKAEIEGLTGWDKKADDLLQEMNLPEYEINIPITSCIERAMTIIEAVHSNFSAFTHTPKIYAEFHFHNQCSKLTAFKSALLWLLDHSSIKKDEKQEKIEALKKQVDDIKQDIKAYQLNRDKQIDDIQRQIKELE